MYGAYSRLLFWISKTCYALITLIVACFLAISCFALLEQAVRTAPHAWTNNWDIVTIGATYSLVVRVSPFLCWCRSLTSPNSSFSASRSARSAASQSRGSCSGYRKRTVGSTSTIFQRHVHLTRPRSLTLYALQTVHEYISQEFARSCLIAYEYQPRGTMHPGWGIPGTEHGGTRFRRSLLDTIADIGAHAHACRGEPPF